MTTNLNFDKKKTCTLSACFAFFHLNCLPISILVVLLLTISLGSDIQCEPNLTVYGVWINNLDPRLPRIALFASKDIEKGEELTFDYMMTGKR